MKSAGRPSTLRTAMPASTGPSAAEAAGAPIAPAPSKPRTRAVVVETAVVRRARDAGIEGILFDLGGHVIARLLPVTVAGALR